MLAAQGLSSPPDNCTKVKADLRDECLVLVVHVGPRYCPKDVPLQESLEFYLKPNLPQMSMTFQDDDMMYKATVDGTYLKLLKCDEAGTNCAVIDEGGTKDRDLLTVNDFNRILVSYIKGEVGVGYDGGTSCLVWFFAIETTVDYVTYTKDTLQLTVNYDTRCVPPVMTTQPPALMTTHAATAPPLSSVSPLQACPMHQVEEDHSLVPVPLNDHLTLAVYPSQPELKLIIANDHLRYEIVIRINDTKILMTSLESPDLKDLRVSAEAPRKSPSGTIEPYVALVKVNCGEPTTPKPSASGISRDVGIVVGVLVIVLLIIALAIVITTMKKRRQATLPSERAPLENQYQQQN
ncbi:hypothetical protein GWK47_047845 [Chionoecetes opilio]|uniref:Uncharacterized protein n=1 Tax=Chionoecetes opilio TaxID=41210 RepID=A0A8J4Y4V6_CHIOP|nr:hypothetical protein GWK47_047845 [Chionoecetes opilio]